MQWIPHLSLISKNVNSCTTSLNVMTHLFDRRSVSQKTKKMNEDKNAFCQSIENLCMYMMTKF